MRLNESAARYRNLDRRLPCTWVDRPENRRVGESMRSCEPAPDGIKMSLWRRYHNPVPGKMTTRHQHYHAVRIYFLANGFRQRLAVSTARRSVADLSKYFVLGSDTLNIFFVTDDLFEFGRFLLCLAACHRRAADQHCCSAFCTSDSAIFAQVIQGDITTL